MDWTQPLVVNDGTLYAGENGGRWLTDFSSYEAAIEIIGIYRRNETVYSARDTSCCTDIDLELAAAVNYDER
jgi:hypothetical protein